MGADFINLGTVLTNSGYAPLRRTNIGLSLSLGYSHFKSPVESPDAVFTKALDFSVLKFLFLLP